MRKTKPKPGDAVLVEYVCHDENEGTELERTDAPVKITIGAEDILSSLEKELLDMLPGETRRISLPPSQAFGPFYEDLLVNVPKSMLELEDEPQVGDTVEVNEDGMDPCPGTVVEIYDNAMLVDCNHPMAGRTLAFELTFVDYA